MLRATKFYLTIGMKGLTLDNLFGTKYFGTGSRVRFTLPAMTLGTYDLGLYNKIGILFADGLILQMDFKRPDLVFDTIFMRDAMGES